MGKERFGTGAPSRLDRFWEDAGLEERDFIFALLLYLSLRLAACEVLNAHARETSALRVSYRRRKGTNHRLFLQLPYRERSPARTSRVSMLLLRLNAKWPMR
jgi:hypothetical protein